MTAKQIGIVLFEDFEELDAVGPWEVLSYWTRQFPEDGYAVTTLAPEAGPVRAAKGLRMLPEHTLADAPALDVVLFPGGQGTRVLMREPAILAWVRSQRRTAELMTSVCTGSLVYAAAGILADRPATTHWQALDELAAIDQSVRIDAGARFVDDGDLITSAGVSAGIDMALHLVHRLGSLEHAQETRHGIQYDPEPPVTNP